MKKVVVSFLMSSMLLFASNIIMAQDAKKEKKRGTEKRKGGDMGAQRLESMKRDLALTDDQATKVKAVLDAEQKNMLQGKKPGEASHEEMKKQMDAQKATTDAKLKEILTADQYKKYQEKEAEMQKNRPSGPKK